MVPVLMVVEGGNGFNGEETWGGNLKCAVTSVERLLEKRSTI